MPAIGGGAGHSAEDVADAFVAARRGASPIAYPGTMPETLDAAYRIQDRALEIDLRVVAGWKVGRIADPLVARFGANRLIGPIFASTIAACVERDPDMPVFEGGFAAAEAEYLLRVGPAAALVGEVEDMRNLIDAVHVGIEIASSPFEGINDHGPAVTISDYGNNNGLVVGPAIPDWRNRDFEQWPVEMSIDSVTVGQGQARAMPGGVFGAAGFLFSLLMKRGRPLQPGQWISSGAVTGVHRVTPGAHVEARFGGAHRVGCRIVAAQADRA